MLLLLQEKSVSTRAGSCVAFASLALALPVLTHTALSTCSSYTVTYYHLNKGEMYANESELESHPLNVTTSPVPILGAIFGCFSAMALVANFVLFVYIISHRLYRNFISSHFIAHLCITNAVALCALLPMFVYNVWTGHNIWAYSNVMCRVQALLTCSVWTVMQFMALCIAGVHLLTFARIHYEQLFGLPPNMLCALAWLIAFGLSLPTITNGHIVIYDPALRHCVWGDT
ncbi:hypothetical protein Tcan_02309 [Toxocara canis]|uniref:G-protein coupled receptors family 1 profile domain-containing protein n=1 Tax=Toxocara canis TaxID=6265 RepID=A0A0B2UQ82_TOXCA|nr:hypothetical protein Tcan_02309 [Toxocara canis]